MSAFLKSAGFVLALSLLAAAPAAAQININITPPSWGPPAPVGARYYYLPTVGGYYDLRDQQYLVVRDGRWQRVRTIGYAPAELHPVIVEYTGTTPWVLIKEHKVKYPKAKYGFVKGPKPGKRPKSNVVLVPAGHPVYVEREEHEKHDNGNGHGKGKGHDKH